ncbi:MAG: hypothetical protein PHS41_07030 [Victivallaceae bacterium]|nr:hypothetical protein [Victivallaceae bacterium]
MRKTFGFLLFAFTAGMLLSAAELARWDFPNPKSIEKCLIWAGKNSMSKHYAADAVPDGSVKGSICFTMNATDGRAFSITPVFPGKVNILSGEKYQLKVRLMSPDKLDFTLHVMQDHAPWARLAKQATARVVTVPNVWQTVTVDFVSEQDEQDGIRMPSFFLGSMKPGQKLYVADAVLNGSKATAAAKPFSTDNDTALGEMKRLKKWQYRDAWKQISGRREKVSLCGVWDFFPVESAKSPLPDDSAPRATFVVPGHWRGGNISNHIRLDNGKRVTAVFGKKPDQVFHAWYRRSIDIPANWKGQVVKLRINRIAEHGEVLVNGKVVAVDTDFTADKSLLVDISDALRYGENNTVAIRVDSTGNRSYEKGGIMGYVFLEKMPRKNFGDLCVDPDESDGNLKIRFRNPAVKSGTLTVQIRDKADLNPLFSNTVKMGEHVSMPFSAPKKWSPDSPHLYQLEATLRDASGNELDRVKTPVGFRAFRVEGSKYMLNGKPINLIADTILDAGAWGIDWKYNDDFFRRQLATLKKFNVNAIYFSSCYPPELLSVADQMGILTFSATRLEYDEHMKLNDEEAIARFRKIISDIASGDRFDNHPSHAGFQIDVWYNFHPGTTNPEYVGLKSGGKSHPAFAADGSVIEKNGGDPNLAGDRLQRKNRLDRAAAMFKKAFPSQVVLTGGSGEVGDVYATHGYHTWGAPFEEMRAFFGRYALRPELPIFVGEHNIPYVGSLYNIFNFSAAGADPLASENFARYSGNEGYRYRGIYGRRALHDYGPGSVQDSTTDRDKDGVYFLHSDLYLALIEQSLATMIPGWRYSGANGIGFFGYAWGGHMLLAGRSVPRNAKFPDDMSAPSFKAEYLPGGANPVGFNVTGKELFLKPTTAAVPFQRVTSAILCDFFETGSDPYGLDHAYFSAETLQKKFVVFNDSANDRNFTCVFALKNAAGETVRTETHTLDIPAGTRGTVDLALPLPRTASRGDWLLCGSVRENGKQVAAKNFSIEIFPAVPVPELSGTLTVCDPEGTLTAYLKKINCPFEEITTLNDLPKKGVLLIGRRALSLNPTVPDFNKLAESGLNTLILEQNLSTSAELMKVRSRHAFINAPAHPVLNGFRNPDFAKWRGTDALADSYEINPATHGWSACGSRNMVASYVFRRPSHGNYRSLLISGFDAYQTPLLEYRHSQGSWIGSQLEIVPRLGKDPVATTIFARMLEYLDQRGVQSKETLFFGGKAGKKLLSRMKVAYRKIDALTPETLAKGQVLLISDPDFDALKMASLAINEFVHDGGRVLYLQTGKEFSSIWLPFVVRLDKQQSRQALHRADSPNMIWRNGWGNNDLYWHDLFEVPCFRDYPPQANAVEPGVLVEYPYGSGSFLLCSMEPKTFGNKYATGKTSRLLSAILTNAGVTLQNRSTAYMPKQGEVDCTVDLAAYNWNFALDPRNVGMQEKVFAGKRGSLKWMTGLIADGREVKIGQSFESFLHIDYDGYAWYVLNLEIPETLRNAAKVYWSIGAIDDYDEVFVNGVKVGATGKETNFSWVSPRLYSFPGSLLKEGMNVIAVRVLDDHGEGGIMKLPFTLSNRPGSGGERGWQTPYQEGTLRDYDYKPDPVRQY